MTKISIYDELASELITCPDFSNYYERLLKSNRTDVERLNCNEIIFLLQTASIYSHCFDEKFKQISYVIAANILEQYYEHYNNLTPIIQYIFISSGLLPSVKKTINDGYQDFFSIYQESNIPYNPFHFKEVIKKQANNKIVLNNIIETIYFTDFQKETFDLLSSHKNISISSPTSSGKSFLLAIFIAKKILEQNLINIVYIVPTRALISQVIADINIELKKLNLDKITLISNISNTLIQNSSKIFVLTQERYHSLLFDSEFNEHIDLLVIDEAQKISEDSRGILLEIVIEESLSRFSTMQIVFLSPNIQNPAEYQKVFDLESLFTKKTTFSPVSQNLYFLNINKSGYELLHSIAEFEKPILILDEKFIDASSIIKEVNKSALFWAIKKFGDCCNIIYCNTPKRCVDDALIFCEGLTSINNSDLNELIELLKISIHNNYFLIKCLRKGVAFHHGRMPTPIRIFIEDLFKKKIINYLFCTSTLLEGVNLPAKNIFIYKPTKGKKNFDKSNFWNLAGRAGRLLKDFSGNIFCINIHEWKGYTPNINDKEYSVESFYTTTINNNSKKLFDAIENIDENIIIKNESFEYSLTRLMVDSLKNKGNDKKLQVGKKESKLDINVVTPLLNTIQDNTKKITIPLNILQKNPSILPLKQQTLLWLFEELPNTVIIPLHPSNESFYPNLERIIQFIDRFFLNKYNNSYRYYSTLTAKWIRGYNFYQLIEFKLHNDKNKKIISDDLINQAIEEIFSELTNTIQYTYKKYLKCYVDILNFFLINNKNDNYKVCELLPVFIEYGTYKPNEIIMQTIGFSRFSALYISDNIHQTFLNEEECILWFKQKMGELKNILPKPIFREIATIIRE